MTVHPSPAQLYTSQTALPQIARPGMARAEEAGAFAHRAAREPGAAPGPAARNEGSPLILAPALRSTGPVPVFTSIRARAPRDPYLEDGFVFDFPPGRF